MKYKKGDIVKIIVDTPVGSYDKVKDEICTVVKTEKTKQDKKTVVILELSNGYSFLPEEVTKASRKEIEETLRNLLFDKIPWYAK